MQFSKSKKTIWVSLILMIFVLIVSLSSLYVQSHVVRGDVCGCVIPIYLFIPLLSAIGLFIGTLIYYLLSPTFETRSDFIENNIDVILGVFPTDESKIIRKIIERQGAVYQSELVVLTKMPKVKVFRVLERLSMKNIIDKKPYGKTNLVTFTENARKLFTG